MFVLSSTGGTKMSTNFTAHESLLGIARFEQFVRFFKLSKISRNLDLDLSGGESGPRLTYGVRFEASVDGVSWFG